MEQISSYDKILQFASDLLNAVRGFLAQQLNIAPPMWLAQAIVLALFLPILYMSVRAAAKSGQPAVRFTAWAATLVVLTISLMVVLTWVSYWRFPLREQLMGEVTGLPAGVRADSLSVDLLDYHGDSLGPRVTWLSGGNQFLVAYSPQFADPPDKVSITGSGCHAERKPRRDELTRDVTMSFSLACAPKV